MVCRSMAAALVALPVALPFALPMVARAQQPPASGTVTGHVTCGETQRPARFAQVMLFGVPKEITQPLDPNAKPDAAQIKTAMNAVMGGMNMVQTETGMDGSFTVANVAPGDYYVFASVPGYVQPSALVQAAVDAGADMTKAIPGIPIMHVSADGSAESDVTVDRGAAVSGTVVWDDGSPASRAIVTVESTKDKGKKLPPQFAMVAVAGGLGGGGVMSISDDRGQFRIAGLAPGEYRVKATLQTKSQFAMQGGVMNLNGMVADKPLVIYAPATFHKADAKPVTLKAGGELTDEAITINLAGMHSVSGRVASAEDHHGINSATVELTDASDKDLVRSAGVDASGNFSVTFVPPGTYNLTVSGAEDTQPSTKKPTGLIKFSSSDTLRSYEDGKQSVVVTDGDVDGLNIELTPSKTTKKDVSLDDLLQ